MTNDKSDLVAANRVQCDQKDEQKAADAKHGRSYPFYEGAVIPQINHLPSEVDRAMQWFLMGIFLVLAKVYW